MSVAAFRAVGRLARRSARCNARNSVLILAMVAAPIALVTGGATIARTAMPSVEDGVGRIMGAADYMLPVGKNFDRASLEGRLPARAHVVVTRSKGVAAVRGGALIEALFAEPEQGMTDPILGGLYELQAGRAPAAAGEVAMNEELLRALDAEVGGTTRLGHHTLSITGVARAPLDLDSNVAVVGPGTLGDHSDFANALIDVPESVSQTEIAAAAKRAVGVVQSSDVIAEAVASDVSVWDGLFLVAGVIALFGTGLIASAAFVVRARRQLRDLGLIGAIGGEPRQVRAVVLLSGTTLGLAGAVVGAALGVGAAFAVHPFLDGLVRRVVGPVEVNVFVLVAAVAMGAIASTAAAYGPARNAGRLSVVDALDARTPPPRPPGKVAGAGLLTLIAGGALTAWATVVDDPPLVAAGLIGMLLGILLGIPLLVSLVGRVAGGLPMSARLAARDAARHGRRTGAAVAAAVIALGVAVAASTYLLSEETYEQRAPVLGNDQLLIGVSNDLAHASADVLASDARAEFPAAIVAPLAMAQSNDPPGQPRPVWAQGPTEDLAEGATTVYTWELYVGDENLLRAVHAESGADELADGKAVVLGGYHSDNGVVRIFKEARRRPTHKSKIPAVAVASPSYANESIPKVVISTALAHDLGLTTKASQYLITAPAPLTSEDRDAARELAAKHPGFFVSSAEDYKPKYALVRTAATSGSLLLALAILAVAVALVTSETRRSQQLLVAVGAGPVAHKKLVAATAGLLALIAALLAVPAGLLPTIVLQIAGRGGRPIVIPWLTIGVVVIATPLLCAALAGLASRTPKLGTLLHPAS